MKLRRGFIKEAEEYALEFRAELGLEEFAPLHSLTLAAHLEIPVFGLSTLSKIQLENLRDNKSGSRDFFFGMTVAEGTFKGILYNDFVHPNRQNSDIMHEISHIILGHPLCPAISENKSRLYDKEHEFEAEQLSFTLMIPKRAALWIVESGISMQEASKEFTASLKVINFRIHKTDAKRWSENRRRIIRAA